MGSEEAKPHPCEVCKMRQEAEAHPNTWKARLWRWHTKICPGWKSYQRHLAARSTGNDSRSGRGLILPRPLCRETVRLEQGAQQRLSGPAPLQHAAQHRFRRAPNDPVDHLAAPEHEQRRDPLHLVIHRGLRVVVHVELGDLEPACVFARQLLDHRRDHAARPAPRRPQVTSPADRCAAPRRRRSRRDLDRPARRAGSPLLARRRRGGLWLSRRGPRPAVRDVIAHACEVTAVVRVTPARRGR